MNIRIFFSSPGDVKMERETAKRIVDRLQSEVGEDATIQPYFWEHEVMVATKDYQQNIPHMDDFDIVVCILWSRLGTPLDPARHPKPGGGGFGSGTEYEFVTAMQAHDLKGTPDIFVFRNMTEPRRPSRPKEVREAVDKEIDRLDTFFESYFEEDAFFTRAINIYSTLGEFEDKLTIALRSYITGRIPVSGERAGFKKPVYQRQPYLGLASFDYEDAPVFFGRTAQIGEIITSFQTQELEAQTNTESPPKHFVLILGSSGSGKSSLARAGVLPMLTKPGVIEGANSWRKAIFKPGDTPNDPILAMVESLADENALPELFADGTTPREIADLIRTQPQGGGMLLRQALTQAGALALVAKKRELEDHHQLLVSEHREEDARVLREKIDTLTAPSVRIALLADQLEEIFTAELSPETLSNFVSILIALASSGRVFLIATLRSDFYPRCLEHPELVALMHGGGTYPLPAPSSADIAQMIRQPAAIAGLSFEENTSTGENLDDLLRDAALKDPTALPLLSYTLEQLYENRSADGLLTLASYRELGGLEGAIGSRAETIFTDLPVPAQAAFDPLCKQLVSLREGGEPTRRRASYSTLTRTPESKTLVDALVTARLLTADQSPSGERIISVAHEALLRHWPRLVAWVEDNRLFLSTRTRVASRMADWTEKNKSDEYLIPRGPNLAAAESILAGHLASLDPLEIEFIGKSSERVRREDQRHLRNARLITAGAIVLCLIAVAGGLLAMAAKRTAQQKQAEAVKQEGLAKESARKATESEARLAYTNGIERLEAGKTREGLTSLAQALTINPEHPGALARLYSEALYSLPKPIPVRSFAANASLRQRISGGSGGPAQRVAYVSPENKPEVLDLNTMTVFQGSWDEEPDTEIPYVSADSNLIMNLRQDRSFRFWNVENGKQSAVLHLSKELSPINLTPDGKYFAEAPSNGKVTIYDTATGGETFKWQQKGTPTSLAISRNSYFVCTSTEELVIYDVADGKTLPPIVVPGFEFVSSFPADAEGQESSRHVAVVLLRKKDTYPVFDQLRFIDLTTGEFVHGSRTYSPNTMIWDYIPLPDGMSVMVASHGKFPELFHSMEKSRDRIFWAAGFTRKAALSPDQRLAVFGASDGTVSIHDFTSGNLLFDPIRHPAQLEDLSLSWDSRYLLTSTTKVATIWDLAVGPALTMPVLNPAQARTTLLGGGKLRIRSPDKIHTYDSETLARGETLDWPEGSTNWISNPSLTAVVCYNGTDGVSFHDVEADELVFKAKWTSPTGNVDSWCVSPDGSTFATCAKGRLFIVSTRDGSLLAEGTAPDVTASEMEFRANNSVLVALFPGNVEQRTGFTLHVWDVPSGKGIPVEQPVLYSSGMSLSPDGRWLAVSANGSPSGNEFRLCLWDLDHPSLPPRQLSHPNFINSIGFSQDSSMLAIAGDELGLTVWSTDTFQPLAAPLSEPAGYIYQIAFSPDGNLVATIAKSGAGSSTRVWDWRSGLPVSAKFITPAPAHTIRFSANGKRLLVIYQETNDNSSARQIISYREVFPSEEISGQLLPLTEAATGMKVRGERIPVPCDPTPLWDEIRRDFPDSWFLKEPALRTVSPAIPIDSMRWIEDPAVGIDALLKAMPSVGLAGAAFAKSENERLKEKRKTESKNPEQDQADQARVDRLALFAERNSHNDTRVCENLGRYALANGDLEKARNFAKRALEIEPDLQGAWELSYQLAKDGKDYGKAVESARKLVELSPENAKYRYLLGNGLWELGKKDEARAEFTRIAEDKNLTWHERGEVLHQLGRFSESLALFKQAADSRKDFSKEKDYDAVGLLYLIVGYWSDGQPEKAVEYYLQFIAISSRVADPELVSQVGFDNFMLPPLLATLKLTLEKHPELAPEKKE